MSIDLFSSLRIITKNIRHATPWLEANEKPWLIRRPYLCAELEVLAYPVENTFICMQEVDHVQLVDIQACFGLDKWDYIGVGRTDGKKAGEYSPIFYRKDLFKLDNFTNTWLSETPDVPSKSWGAGSIRIVTRGDFTHIASGKKITVMDTHLDDQSALARAEGAKIILSHIAKLEEKSKDYTVILAGDFNSESNDDAYKLMVTPGSGVSDSKDNVPKQMRYGFYYTYSSFQVDSKTDRPLLIDFVFYNKNSTLIPRTYSVMENKYDNGPYNSDHRAVVVDFTL